MEKSILTLLAALFLTASAFSQVKTQTASSKSNIEMLSEQSGVFVKREFLPIGKVKAVTVEVIKITNIVTGKVVSALKLSGSYSTSYTTSTKTGYLDADEVDGFLNTVNYVKEKVFTQEVPAFNVEYNFNARGGFSGGAYLSGGKTWSGYVQLEKYDSNSIYFLKQEDFNAMAELISQAKAKL